MESKRQRVESNRAGALTFLTFVVFLVTYAILMLIPNMVLIMLNIENTRQFEIVVTSLLLGAGLSATLNLTGAFTELINSWYPDMPSIDKTKNFPEEPITTIPMIG